MVKTFVPGLRLSADSVLSQVGKLLDWSWKDEMVIAKNEVDEKLSCSSVKLSVLSLSFVGRRPAGRRG